MTEDERRQEIINKAKNKKGAIDNKRQEPDKITSNAGYIDVEINL